MPRRMGDCDVGGLVIHTIRLTIDVNGRSATHEIRINGEPDACDALDPEEIADAFGAMLELSLAESEDDDELDVESLLDEDDDDEPWSLN